ncbi:hypothetical protein MHK_003926 [Candidatus Magnetomorum sp. HK-1]|nr:hypothetical protein MHK_003926 [Candidatus Magnetomorum sp. HK-1]
MKTNKAISSNNNNLHKNHKAFQDDFDPDEYDLAIFKQWEHIKDINEYPYEYGYDDIIIIFYSKNLSLKN